MSAAKAHNRRMQRQFLQLILTMLVFFNTEGAKADLWQFIFGLSGDNTAYDFMSAPISREVEWEMSM
jgi:hypothetical protein